MNIHAKNLTNKLMNFAQKVQTNIYLSSIKDAFILIVPLTLAASFATLINNVVLSDKLPWTFANPEYWGPEIIDKVNALKFMLGQIEFGALQWIAPMTLIAISYTFSKAKNVERPLVNALIVFASFIILLPKETVITSSNLFAGTNLFTALVVGILMTKFLIYTQKFEQFKIVLPDQVPPMVAKSFATLIPAIITVFLAGVIATFFMYAMPFGFSDFSAFISGIMQQPFLALAHTGLGGASLFIIYVIFVHIFWLFGIHGHNVMEGFSSATLSVLAINNQTIFAQTGDAFSPQLAVFSRGFYDAYVGFGGTGATIGLVLAIWLVSKRADYKALNKIAAPAGLFNINEPLLFGLPIILNPLLAIPFLMAPLVSIIIPGILTTIGWLPKIVIMTPWVTPPVINAFLATGGNWLAALVSIINIILMTSIYIPFVMMANKMQK